MVAGSLSPPMSPSIPFIARLGRRPRQWLGLLVLLGLAWGGAIWWLQFERQVLQRHESEKLEGLVKSLEGVVAQQLIGINTALLTIDGQRAQRSGDDLAQLQPLLHTLAEAMPGVHALSIMDAQGRVQASSASALPSLVEVLRPGYELARAQHPQAGRLHIAAPQIRPDGGAQTLALTLGLRDAQGRWQGAVSALLAPSYFDAVLRTAQPSAETWSALVHEQGRLFALLPEQPRWLGEDFSARQDSVLYRHLLEGRDVSLQRMRAVVSGDLRLMSVRSVRPAGLDPRPSLVVAVGRSVHALEAPWRRQRAAVLAVGLSISLLSVLALMLWQRRQRLIFDLQQRQKQQEQEAAEWVSLALEGGALGVWDWDVASGSARFDARYCAMLGESALEPTVGSWHERLHPDDAPLVQTHLQLSLEGESDQYEAQFRMRHREGHWIWVLSRGRVMARDAQGRVLRLVGTHLDITELRAGQDRLHSQALYTQAVLEHMVDGVITIDVQGRVESLNPAACAMFGYQAHELLGRNVSILMPEHDARQHGGYMSRYLAGGAARIIGKGRDVEGRRADGSVFPMSLAVSRIEHEGRTRFIGLTRDITERKRAEAEIERLAFYDALTGLPNRRLLLDRLRQALAASRRKARRGAVMFIDMDNFKSINDTLGHGIGDRLLQDVARRLQAVLRTDDTVARWGGDEFVVLLQDLGAQQQDAVLHAEAAAEKLLRVLGQPYTLGGQQHHSTPSIGIVLWGEEGGDCEELLKHADHAMYQAKSAGRNRLCFFDPATQAAMAERALLEAELRRAVDLQQLELHCQPQVARDGRLMGGELLMRWRHAERGFISPAQFIPLAEQTGLIAPLGEWALQQCCAWLSRWTEDPALAPLTLAVNLSALQLRQKGFLGLMQQQLARSGVPAGRLKIELTESALLEDTEAVIGLMAQLRALGLQFSLDDFGTGYSSLAYLKRLPLTQLKIDQSFVRDLLEEPNARAIARAIIQMGDSLGLEVIAEGVETRAQRDLLAEQGCHAFQGWFYGRPMPIADFEALARTWSGKV
jgi:diguanylate cyclase (GGDEF)-like protein/PAS domain S-box-containing protein